MSSIKILAIESSCDETSAAVIEDGKLLSNIIATQIDIHALYGGVVPEIASRSHLEAISSVVDSALNESGYTLEDMSAIAVTKGPGLVGALLIGVSYAKALAMASGKPIIGVNHMAGHISANFLLGAKPPFICLVVSGGHTMIVRVDDYTSFTVLGSTRDDAAGEAFDKVARVMGLAYPGGAKLDKLADLGDEYSIDLPKAMLKEDNYDFSFSGMKSAVLNYLNKAKMKGEEVNKENLCASFRRSVVDILVTKLEKAAKAEGLNTIAVCGGVACNSLLRKELKALADRNGYELFIPDNVLCSDNAGMIAAQAYHMYKNGDFSDLKLNAVASLELCQ
ncbi:MAG: tRNA (adenosine(37)-N6)-threonylcarbamoyltransferase complex transferase subunit TsaD [Anaerofustis stercorihominis]|nr:tRNA (adenosine(37)-N6)-threonylcarbamoyltransferase complex transferase subunit TsaD [Anaerofustis stercorihominis]